MRRDILILPDGTEISSGVPGKNAVISATLSQSVNDDEDISLGSACAAMLEVTVFAHTQIGITAGTEFTYFVEEDGERSQLGIFICEKPTRASEHTCKFTAYDRMTLLDKDISAWISNLTEWPYTLQTLFEMLCGHCGLEIASGIELPGGDFSVHQFSVSGLTGRQLLRWIGQVAGRFFTVNDKGTLEARWYTDSGETVGFKGVALELVDGLLLTAADEELYTVDGGIPYYSGSLKYEEYATAPIQKVMIRQSQNDVGAVWPDGADEEWNTYIIEGNPLLTAQKSEDIQGVAQRLYEQLLDFSYTPFQCRPISGSHLVPGQILSFTDAEGNARISIIMSRTVKGYSCTIESSGNPTLQSTSAFNNLDLKDLQGKVLTIERGVEGLEVENSDMAGNLASMELQISGITTRVESVETKTEESLESVKTQSTVLSQRADGLELSITDILKDVDTKADKSQVTEITEHFHFGQDGLTISNSATGMGIGISEERVEFTGGSDPTTVIYPNEMQSTNLTVFQSLTIGEFAYIPRTNGNLSFRYVGGSS